MVTQPPTAQPSDSVEDVDPNGSYEDVLYDVCVIGSGAGGALAAFRIGAAGKSVLLIDSGNWIPPQNLSTRHDLALAGLYKTGGVQPALPKIGAIFGNRAAGVNFLQAEVIGGGPYVNNAIQLPIDQAQFERAWKPRGFPFTWDELTSAMAQVARELKFPALSLDPSLTGDPRASVLPGARSSTLLAAAQKLWPGAAPNPVSLWDCVGCGGCNIGCRYNAKTGGPHGPRAAGSPQSYLMRALRETNGNVKLRGQLQALQFHVGEEGLADRLSVRDLATGQLGSVQAKCYVLAAGPIASSRILQETDIPQKPKGPSFGERVAANVTTPLLAIMPADFDSTPPNPGVQMCFYVEPETGLLLEGWFDYPAGVSAGTSGLPRDVAAAVGKYPGLNVLGVVVPIDDLATVHPPPVQIASEITDEDFGRLLRAMAYAACALYQSGALSVTPAHRLNTNMVGSMTIDPDDARNGRVDKIADDLLQRLEGPQNLALQTPHPQGGNAIASSPSQGVVAGNFKVFGTANVFAADSSLFPAGCGRNPQLTTLALAHLAASSILDCFQNNELGKLAC